MLAEIMYKTNTCNMNSCSLPPGSWINPPVGPSTAHYTPVAGNTLHDVGSGIGFVHNAMMFDHAEKGVLWGPWLYKPRPFW